MTAHYRATAGPATIVNHGSTNTQFLRAGHVALKDHVTPTA